MTTEYRQVNRLVPLWLVILISVFAFFGGALGGILFCGHYSHDPWTSASGPATSPGTSQIEMAEAEVKEHPSDVRAWTRLGNLYFDSDQFEKAITAYRRSLQLDPQDADVWTDLGIMYRRTGSPDQAIEAFDQAVAADPGHENARLNKGIVLMYDLKDREGALQAWEALLQVNPLAEAWENQSVLELVLEHRGQEPSGAK